jgi:undecaprenyl-diphosphatase
MAARRGDPDRGLAHPWVVVTVAAVALLASWLVARHRPVPGWETDLTRRLSDTPDWLAHGLWPVMQLGTLYAPIVLAVVVGVLRRDWVLAACVVVAGMIAWFGAKVVKHAVGRGRPSAYMPGLVVREGSGRGHGLGYLSGHSAVAAATLTVVMVAVPRRARPWLVAVIALVGVARVVHGVHFPADVVGGWAFGALIGLAVVAGYERVTGWLDAGGTS